MEVKTDETQKKGVLEKKDVLDIMFQVRGVNEALAPGTPRVIWVGLTLINT